MFFHKNAKPQSRQQVLPVQPAQHSDPPVEDSVPPEDELRRQMYERIARGNALNEAEAAARRQWRG